MPISSTSAPAQTTFTSSTTTTSMSISSTSAAAQKTSASSATTTNMSTSSTTAPANNMASLRLILRLGEAAADLSTTPHTRPLVIAGPRSSKTSLGMISTPLIWPVRRKPETLTRGPRRPVIYLTKPPAVPPMISMPNTSPQPKVTTSISVSGKADLMSEGDIQSVVVHPWQPAGTQNGSEHVESFHAASHNNRKNKPLAPHWALEVSTENSTINWTESLEYSSGMEPFIYDIGLGEESFSLFDFQLPYSLDESLVDDDAFLADSLNAMSFDDVGLEEIEMPLNDLPEAYLGRNPLAGDSVRRPPAPLVPMPVFYGVPNGAGAQTYLPEPNRFGEITLETNADIDQEPSSLDPWLFSTPSIPSVLDDHVGLSNKTEETETQTDVPLASSFEGQLSVQGTDSSEHLDSFLPAVSEVASLFPTIRSSELERGPFSDSAHIPPSQADAAHWRSPEAIVTPAIEMQKALYYRLSFVVNDNQAQMNEMEVERTAVLWLNQTFQNWTYSMYVANVSIQISDVDDAFDASKRYTCLVLLVYRFTSESPLEEAVIEDWLRMKNLTIGSGLELDAIVVQAVENCKAEENPTHYNWPESRPTVTQFVPCFPNKALNASRTCVINLLNYSSFWDTPDFTNCTDLDGIEVSAENAAEVVTQLADITQKELSTKDVSKVVTKLKEVVNVAKINASLATTMVTVFSNVMTSSDVALAATSELALKTVDEMVQKIVFDGPSLSISSENLALGISALNTSEYDGTSFSAFLPSNETDVQIDFEAEQQNPLAAVTLPNTLLSNLSDADVELISRLTFMFFSKIGLFQDQTSNGLDLRSYVVASSVGNQTIKNLQDPVRIEIVHLQNQSNPKPVCVFWDFSLQNGTGGWNSAGCRVSPESNEYKTVCLCDHLTHFGILMDISGTAHKIDAENTKILTFITYIGCGISAIFSAATLLTYIAFEKIRRDYPSKILMNLSTSLLLLNMLFLLDGWLASFEMEGLCIAVAAFLHYFLLTSFTWMGLESVHMYIALVKVFNTYIRRYILKFCIVGWGIPAAIISTVVAIDRKFYGKEYYGKEENSQGSSEFCWIRNQLVFYIACVGYFCVIFLLNVAMFIVVMMQICGRNGKRSNRTMREEVLRNLRSMVSLTFLLGMTWGFAFFAWGPVNLAFMYLFAIFNSLQGLFIFIFHCAMKENVQKQWRRYLCCGKFRLAENSDWSKTATNNTKKVSSDNIGKSLSSSSFGSSTANWTSKAKATLNPFAKRSSNTGKGYASQISPKFSPVDGDASSSIIPVHQVIDKVKGYCSVRSDNFYKNIIMSDSFSHSTKF
ncbi:hypothetical protein GJAV_G00117960 [Gymnothorax javanicus]|nr:hypothetical protein GJAV_G00117960 [Gymnothorax javanicus]